MNNESNPQSEIRNPKSFWLDESGQGILFAAASLVLLVGFVALVYNVGRLTERRTKIQLAADAAAYSGAMVEANSLSTIGWINSAMAQIYYNSLKYAVDVNVTGVAAKMELILSQYDPDQGGVPPEAVSAFQEIASRRGDDLQRAKQWMLDLSRIENAIAILTPRLVEEEMFAVAARAGAVAGRPAVERVSLYPSYRMFPRGSSSSSFLIEQLYQGWRITELTGQQMVSIRLDGDEWHLEYSMEGILRQEVVIAEEGPQRWRIRYYQPPGNLIQEIILVHDEQLGWVVWGSDGGGSEGDEPLVEFQPVDMDGDGTNEGTRVTIEGTSAVFMRGPEGDLYLWDSELERYVNMTSNETEIGGVIVRINVTNRIHFPGGWAEIGVPTHVHIGRAHLVLRKPPTISTNLGPVRVSVQGFDADSFDISVGGFSLRHADADGEWRKHYERLDEYWWRHRLTEQEAADDALQQWQYDRQVIGAHLAYEDVGRAEEDNRFLHHALDHRGPRPPWTIWFNPVSGIPRSRELGWQPQYSDPDANGIRHLLEQPPEYVYYLTRPCTYCEQDGRIVCPTCNGTDHDGDGLTDVGDAPPYTRCPACNGSGEVVCPACHACDHDGNPATTEVRVFVNDLLSNDGETQYMEALVPGWRAHTQGYTFPSSESRPLVLAEEFFRFGMNVGAWRSSPSGMFAAASPESEWGFREPDWGYVAIASARVGVRDPEAQDGYRYDFVYSREEREDWCNNSPNNLYSADVKAKLYPCRDQIQFYDLDRDLLIGGPIRDIRESPLSYLWDAILGTRQSYQYDNWLDRYDGRSDPRVGAALRNMRNRRGSRFDFADEDLDAVVAH